MNSIQGYGITRRQATSFQGNVKHKAAQKLIDYPLVQKVMKENPNMHASKVIELVRTKVQNFISHNKALQEGKITNEQACLDAMYNV